jgi:hypothetical protein
VWPGANNGAVAALVEDFGGLLDLPAAYARALEAGERTLEIELRSGCYGLRPEEASGTLRLAAGGAVPDLDLRIRAVGGPAVLAGIPLALTARRVALEDVALVGLPGTALAVTATEAIELAGVTVLDVTARPRERAAVALTAAGTGGTALRLVRTVVARASAADAVVGAIVLAGAWFDAVALEDCTLAGEDAPALLSIDAAASLRIASSRLRAPAGQALLRMGWPPNDGEIRDSALSARAAKVLDVREAVPPDSPPLRLAGTTEVTTVLSELPAHITADPDVRETAGQQVDAAVDGAIRAAAERLVAVEPELGPRLAP